MAELLEPVKIGAIELTNRIVMTLFIKMRANDNWQVTATDGWQYLLYYDFKSLCRQAS